MEPEESIPGGEPAEETAAAPSEAAAVPAVPAVEPAPESDAPWAAELREKFSDPETFKAVDEYMRSTVQPYVTDLETKSKPDRDATRLWESFHEDPISTYEGITRELWENDPERAEAIIAASRGQVADDLYTDDDEDTPAPAPDDNLTTEQRQFIEEGIQAREQKQYEEFLGNIESKITSADPEVNPDGAVPFDKEIFQHQLVMADGNAEEATSRYRAYVEKSKQAFGLNLPAPGSLSTTPDPPPPTINSTSQAGAVTPPQQKDYKGDVSAAIDDMFTEDPPPTVPS